MYTFLRNSKERALFVCCQVTKCIQFFFTNHKFFSMLTKCIQYADGVLSRNIYNFGYLNRISDFTVFLQLFFTKQHTLGHSFSRAQNQRINWKRRS
jgi:hypothetical protein